MLSIGIQSKKQKFIVALFFSVIIFSSIINTQNLAKADGIIWLNLVLKTSGGGNRPDYGLYIANYLERIGIEVEVKIEEWAVFVGTLILTHDFDLAIVGLSGGGATPDMRSIYTEDGSLNVFGLNTEIPYGNLSEQMQTAGIEITDLDARQQHYYEWQQLMMDKIVPMLPLYAPRSYVATWSNTLGYESRWGIVDSLPYMSFEGLHEGQVSTNEFSIADANWRELNPLFIDDTSSSFIWALMSESIVQFSPDLIPLKTGLVYDWEQIDEYHYKFYMRDNVYWNPSYNVTSREASSDPLDTIPTGELMVGLKAGEYSTGINQQVKAKDAVFTYLVWANPTISEDPSFHDWISDIYVDPIDDLAFHIHVDGNPATSQKEHYVDMWVSLSWDILPEFFLNSSQPDVSYTIGEVKCVGLYPEMINTPQWTSYSTSAFGCGKFMMDYYIRNSISVLKKSPYWFGVGARDGTTDMTSFVDTLNVRVIPDASAELAEFKAGKLDWTSISLFPAERKQMQADSRFDVQTLLQSSLSFMAFNLQRPVIGGTANFEFHPEEGKEEYTIACAIRKVICYSIDREEMNDVFHDGEYFIAHSVIYPFTKFYYYDDIIKYDYDLEAAQDWLYINEDAPNVKVTVENHNTVDKDIIVKIEYPQNLDITGSTLSFRINNGSWNHVTMTEESNNVYSFNLGSNRERGDLIEFYFRMTISNSDYFFTKIYSFNVGTRNP